MIACVDVHYSDPHTVAACVTISAWADGVACDVFVCPIDKGAPYMPAAFYQRELPCILQVVQPFYDHIRYFIVDGYVWLDGEKHPGLGAFAYYALGDTIQVIGVAKKPYHGAKDCSLSVNRRDSKTPLYITSSDIELEKAAGHIASMHGPYRISTMLRYVDRLFKEDSI